MVEYILRVCLCFVHYVHVDADKKQSVSMYQPLGIIYLKLSKNYTFN